MTGAKVVTSAKSPGSKCFGLVTMSTVEEANQCIEHLNKTEFNGRIISLEKASFSVLRSMCFWLFGFLFSHVFCLLIRRHLFVV